MGGANLAANKITKAKGLPYKAGDEIPGTKQRVVKQIGRGGFSTVYLTVDVKLMRQHATKVLDFSRFDSSGDNYRELFDLEMQAMALVEHENICRIITAGETEDELAAPYYVMEYLQGADLHTLISVYRNKKWKFSTDAVLKLAIGIFDGLSAAHAKGIVHRDLKPANIFLQRLDGNDSRPKLVDFGTHSISGHVEKNARGEKVYRGTFRYSAPEQWIGAPCYPQTDLYAAGIVLYEVLTGATPFHRFPHDDDRNLRKAHLTEVPRPIREINADVPEPLAALVESLLHKDHEKRGVVGSADEGKPVTAARVVQQLRSIRNKLNEDATSTQVLTSPNVAIPVEDDPSEGGTKPHPLLRPGLTDIARTDYDMPEWLDRLRRGEPAEDELGPEPEVWVPTTEEDWAIYRELTNLSIAEPLSGDVSVDNSIPTSDLRPEVTATAPVAPVPDVTSAETPFETRVIPTRTISIAEVPPAPAPSVLSSKDLQKQPAEPSAPAANTADVEVPPSVASAVTQGPLLASPDDSSSLNRYVESPLEAGDAVVVAPTKITTASTKALVPRSRRAGGLWRTLTDTWSGLIFMCVAVTVAVTLTILRNPDLFGDRPAESSPTAKAPPPTNPPLVAPPSDIATSKALGEIVDLRPDASAPDASAVPAASSTTQPAPSDEGARHASPRAKPTPSGAAKPSWLDSRK